MLNFPFTTVNMQQQNNSNNTNLNNQQLSYGPTLSHTVSSIPMLNISPSDPNQYHFHPYAPTITSIHPQAYAYMNRTTTPEVKKRKSRIMRWDPNELYQHKIKLIEQESRLLKARIRDGNHVVEKVSQNTFIFIKVDYFLVFCF